MTMTKNISIEFFRFFFMLDICIAHLGNTGLQHGYIGVEFFFLLSGALLYRSFLKDSTVSGIDYTLKKFRRFFPKMAAALFVTVLLDIFAYRGAGADWWIHYVLSLLSNLLLIQNLGFYPHAIIGVTWYLSVLLIAGFFIWNMLSLKKEFIISIVFPILTVLLYTYLFSRYTILNLYNEGADGFFHAPLLRGFAAMCIGVLISKLTHEQKPAKKNVRMAMDIAYIAAIPACLLLLFYKGAYDQYLLLFISVIVIGCFDKESVYSAIFKNRIWEKAGGITYEMLLFHIPVNTTVNFILSKLGITNVSAIVIINLVCVIIVSIIVKQLFGTVFKQKRTV